MKGCEPLDEPKDISGDDWDEHRQVQGLISNGTTRRACADRMYSFEMALQCGLCFGLLSQPESLRCGHSFCSECIRPQLLKCLSTCPTCHAPCTVDDLRPDATLAAAIELFEPARWSVLSVLDEYAAICIKSTPLRTSSTDDSSLSAGDRGALDTVNEEPAPLPMLMTEKEAVAAGIDATVTNVPVITAAAVVTRASEAATEEATMSGTSASVEVTAVPVESEAATAAETVVRKAMVKDALDATIPAERKVAPTIKSVSAAPIAEAPATDSVAPSTTLAASTTPSKRLSWSWPPGIRFNAEATARGFDQWHAPSPWRVLLSVHTNVPFFFNVETQKGQWEIPDGAYPRESDSKVREPSNKAATADAIAETPADATTEVAATNAMKTDDRASSTAEKDFRTAIATGDIMRADDRSTVAEAAENVATRAGAEATEETAKQDDGAKDNAKTITTVATGEEVDESDNRGTISEFTTVPMADDKNIFVGDRVQVLGRHWSGMHKNGGMALVKMIHADGTLDVKLVVEGNTYRKLDPVFVVKGGDGNASDLIDPPALTTKSNSVTVKVNSDDGSKDSVLEVAAPVVEKRPPNGPPTPLPMKQVPINGNTTEGAEHTIEHVAQLSLPGASPALTLTSPSSEQSFPKMGARKGDDVNSDSEPPMSGSKSSRADNGTSFSSRNSSRRNSSNECSSSSSDVNDDKFWVCRRCTLQNSLDRNACIACASRAPPRRAFSPSSKPPSSKRPRASPTSTWVL